MQQPAEHVQHATKASSLQHPPKASKYARNTQQKQTRETRQETTTQSSDSTRLCDRRAHSYFGCAKRIAAHIQAGDIGMMCLLAELV
jgi:hypothetical protein